jgi:hypothetical protein
MLFMVDIIKNLVNKKQKFTLSADGIEPPIFGT